MRVSFTCCLLVSSRHTSTRCPRTGDGTLQHVLHGTDELGIGLGRDAPTCQGLSSFFSASQELGTPWQAGCPLSHIAPGSSQQLQRPTGTALRRFATGEVAASPWPSSFLGRRLSSLRPKAASTPSSTQRRRTRPTVASPTLSPGYFLASSPRTLDFPTAMRAWVLGRLYAAARPRGHQSLQFLLLLYTQTDPVPLRWHPHPPNSHLTH